MEFVKEKLTNTPSDSFLAKKTTGDINDLMSYFVSLDDLVQGIREDLSVVEGDVSDRLESFVQFAYDQYKLIKDPNIVDD